MLFRSQHASSPKGLIGSLLEPGPHSRARLPWGRLSTCKMLTFGCLRSCSLAHRRFCLVALLVQVPSLFQLYSAHLLHRQSLALGRWPILSHRGSQAGRSILHPVGQAQPLVQATKLNEFASRWPGRSKNRQPIRHGSYMAAAATWSWNGCSPQAERLLITPA